MREVVLALGILLFDVGCQPLPATNLPTTIPEVTATEQPFQIIETDDFTAIIYSQAWAETHVRPSLYWPYDTGPGAFWTPTEADVFALQSVLDSALRAEYQSYTEGIESPAEMPLLSEYRQQYVGLVFPDGKKAIYGSLFCSDDDPDWQERLIAASIVDGGTCYVDVLYNIETDELSLSYHADP